MLQFKADVRVAVCRDQAIPIVARACEWSLEVGVGVRVNSWQDPAPGRMGDSLHIYGLALDLGVSTELAADRARLANYLRRTLPPGYDLVLEADHLHVEWDAHRPALT